MTDKNEAAEQAAREGARKVLEAQAEAIGLEVDGRWSVETLSEKVAEAQAAREEADKQTYKAAKKTPVRLKRNAFPVAGVKALKGDVVEVPVDLAKKWIADGVAERADPFPGE